MTGTRDWLTRERGSRDWRLLPAAICGWTASLAAHAGFAYCMSHDGMLGALPAVLTCMIPLAVLAGLPFPRLPASVRRRITLWHASVTVCAIAAMVCAASALTYDLLQWRDPASRAAAEGDASVVVTARATSPTVISDRRSNDCRADARITSVTIDGVRQTSSARARIYADRPECGKLKQDGTSKIAGRISEARYGAMPLWLTDVTTVEHVRPPNLPMRAIGMMQEASFVQTARLSDQGKVLVPGLTLGVLGQDYVPAEGDGTDIDSTYAAQVEDAFQRSGIVHLMAVSGGHLAVTAALVRSVCSFFLLPRRFTALLVAMSYIMLSACVFPSDSVSRALLMGLSGAACLFIGRRGQAMASLSWTTLAMLMACPHMSQSFGFALSCAAVLGIVLFADTLNAWMEPVLPRFVAEALSMTIAAQVFTLPIQVLIEPELPVFSIPANLMVAPFVGFATLAGLASLAVSWLIPGLGLQLARAASWGSAVMELATAMYLSREKLGKSDAENRVFSSAMATVLTLLSPITPHLCEELWQRMGHTSSLQEEAWPVCEESALVQDTVTIALQVNGKLRGTIEVPAGADKARMEEVALADAAEQRHTSGLTIRQVVVVPGMLVNVVAN